MYLFDVWTSDTLKVGVSEWKLFKTDVNTLWSPFPEIFAELRKLQASALLLVWVWGRSESLVGHKIFYEGFSGCNLIILYQVTDKV